MNLYGVLFFLLFINTIFCCENWFRKKHNLRRQHILKKNLHSNKGKNTPFNFLKTPKDRNIRRKEKSKNYGKLSYINNSERSLKNNKNNSSKKQLKGLNPIKKKNKKVKVNNFEVWNNKITKTLKKNTETFIKNVVKLPNVIHKTFKNNKSKRKNGRKTTQKNKTKHFKSVNVEPGEIDSKTEISDKLENIPNSTCIENNDCSHDEECGSNGNCYNGKCRCSCIDFSSCISNDDCPGINSVCHSKCIGRNGTTTHCGIGFGKRFKFGREESQCSRGSQCLSGICVGGGRKRILGGNQFYEAISCSITSKDISCKGIGIERCSTESNLIFRHTDQSLVGTNGNISITNIYHMKLNVDFPTCYSTNGDFAKCGENIEDSCIEGAFCGYCKC
uniref:Defensin-like protein n=1 Tax=Strongyloides venezuelensis TaxID=75913 RepID=A0A0K0FKV9_STRVS